MVISVSALKVSDAVWISSRAVPVRMSWRRVLVAGAALTRAQRETDVIMEDFIVDYEDVSCRQNVDVEMYVKMILEYFSEIDGKN